jgi:hypothetical protein
MKFGNIIYKEDLVNHKKVGYINYINENIPISELPNDLPTLYVGWYNMKELNKENPLTEHISILEKTIFSNKLYWEFSFNENKSQHVNGVEEFVINVSEYYFMPRYTYINLCPIHFMIKDFDDLFDILPKTFDAVYKYKEEFIYLLKDNRITGLDWKLYNYFEFKSEEILTKIKNNTPENMWFNDNDGKFYQENYNILPYFEFLKRYMVVLLSN